MDKTERNVDYYAPMDLNLMHFITVMFFLSSIDFFAEPKRKKRKEA